MPSLYVDESTPCDGCRGEGERWVDLPGCPEAVPEVCPWCKGTGRQLRRIEPAPPVEPEPLRLADAVEHRRAEDGRALSRIMRDLER